MLNERGGIHVADLADDWRGDRCGGDVRGKRGEG